MRIQQKLRWSGTYPQRRNLKPKGGETVDEELTNLNWMPQWNTTPYWKI
jgi:hypothetical protein